MVRLIRYVSFIVVIAILLGIAYLVRQPFDGERFTELYLLGPDRSSATYPNTLNLPPSYSVDALTSDEAKPSFTITYGDNRSMVTDLYARVIVSIVNHERSVTNYRLSVRIDEVQSEIWLQDIGFMSLGPLTLKPNSSFEGEIGIKPNHLGIHQKVELLLYKNDSDVVYRDLYFWIDVTH